ncbi:MAG: iron-sulfur cluster assembly accessory protein [Pseudomonadota bacterium]|nr:MAG: iron-sulfur cluster assembly accessory protein [Pseudomonadota bacterium]
MPKPSPAVAPTPAPAAKPASGIRIDISAAQRIRQLLEERGTPDAGLRIRVKGGGCTGLRYDMEFADAPREKDRVFEEHGVRVYIDPKSYIFLIGTTLSYHKGLLESGFKLENPNVKKSCGCGESFSV